MSVTGRFVIDLKVQSQATCPVGMDEESCFNEGALEKKWGEGEGEDERAVEEGKRK